MADPTVFSNGYLAFTTSTGGATYTMPAGVKSVTIPISRAELDDAVMGDDISATYPGIVSAPISCRIRQNFASTGIDAWAWTRFNNKTPFKVKVRPVNGAVATTNPTYRWTRVYISSITPVSAGHGETLWNDIELRPMSGGTLTRATNT